MLCVCVVQRDKVAVFGQATPVDTTSRDKEVDAKIQRDKEELEQLAKQKVDDDEERGDGERRRRGSEEDRGGRWGGSRDRGPPHYGGRGNSRERPGEQMIA